MELSVRAYIFDEDDRVLLVKHSGEQPWVLPWGHLEEAENIYTALARELDEELGIKVVLVGAENDISNVQVKAMPLPVSIHRVRYEHRTKWPIEKLEMFFFARLKGVFVDAKSSEIYEYDRFDTDDILDMDPDTEVFAYIQEILDQNLDLLELVG